VRGEHLDGVLATGQRGVQPLLVLRGGAQEGEEGQQGGLAVQRGEGRGGVEEGAQRLAAAGGEGVRRGGQLDVQAGDGEHPVQHVHQRVAERAAQLPYLGGEPGEAHPGLGREAQAVVAVAGVGGAVASPAVEEGLQRVGERDGLGGVGPGRGGGQPLGVAGRGVRSGRAVPDQQPGAASEQCQVARPDPPARAGEQPHQRGVRGGVLEHLADRDQVGHLGQPEQPGEPDHLDRHVPGHQRGVDVRELGGGAAQHGDRAGRGAGPGEVRDRVGEPAGLVVPGGQQCAAHQAVPLGAGGRAQRLDALVAGTQRGGEAVGEVEQPAPAAAVLGERVAAGGGAVGVREVPGEVVEVGDRGAAPAVDGLAGVADRGDRVPGPRLAAEQPGEQQPLRDRGVLVLVQQHDAVAVPEHPADLGPGRRQLGGPGDLVPEVEQVAAALLPAVRLREAGEIEPGADHPERVAHPGVAAPRRVEPGQPGGQRLVVRAQPPAVDQVLGHLPGEREQVPDQRGQPLGEVRERSGRGAQHPGGELVAGGVGEQPGGGLDADPHPVLGEQPPGEGVVGGDLGLPRALRPRFAVRVGRAADPGFGECLPDPLGQFSGRLVGEGQPEHPVRRDLPGPHQPHHPRGHHRGLPRPGPGHDHLRRERRGDAGQLLGREGNPEQRLELLGIGEARGHRVRLPTAADSGLVTLWGERDDEVWIVTLRGARLRS
jgi:hypothetical protein